MRDHDNASPCRVDLGFGDLSASSGDHIGQYYQSEEESRSVVVGFLSKGLSSGEKCVYLAPDGAHQAIEAQLTERGIDTNGAKRSGQLVIDGGRPEPDELKARLTRALDEIPERFSFLRWVGDMTWSFVQMPNTETLMEWETMCNVVHSAPVVFLCQYDLRRFVGTVILDAMQSHPLSIVGTAVHQNPYYRDPEDFLAEIRSRPATPLVTR